MIILTLACQLCFYNKSKQYLFRFLDKNKNNQVDGEIEKRGFLDHPLNLFRDTNLIFRVFDEIPSKSFVKKIISPYYGFIQIILNQKTLINIRPLLAINAKNIFELPTLVSVLIAAPGSKSTVELKTPDT